MIIQKKDEDEDKENTLTKRGQRQDEDNKNNNNNNNNSSHNGQKGGWNSWSGWRNNNGGKGDGKGKGKSKGPSPMAVAKARAAKVPGATPICDEYRRTGQCSFEANSGRKCNFLHVDKLPPQLSSIEGLISTDLKGLKLDFDISSGICTCCPCTEENVKALASVETEVNKVYNEMMADYDLGGDSQGFR